MANVDIKVKTTQQGAQAIQGMGRQFGNLNSSLLAVVGTAAAVTLALKETLDVAEQGQALTNLTRSFDNLTNSIGTTSDAVLTRLQAATKGMVADADLMLSANRFISMGLAQTAGEAEKLTTIAVSLGAVMGKNATAAMEEFALMLANQSIPRLDTFGISAGKVRTRIEELQEANTGMTRETAFMTAVMEQAEISMQNVGEVAGNSATVIKAQMTNAVNELKMALADGLAPALKEASEATTAFASDLQNQRAIVNSAKQLELLTVNYKDYKKAVEQAALAEAGYLFGSEYRNRQTELYAEVVRLLGAGVEGTAEELVGFAQAAIAANTRAAAMNDAFEDLQQSTKDVGGASQETARIIDDAMIGALKRDIIETRNAEDAARKHAEAEEARKAALEQSAKWAAIIAEVAGKAADEQRGPIEDLMQAQKDLQEAQGEYVQGYTDYSRDILKIQEELGRDLTDEQRDALQDQLGELDEYSAEAIAIWHQLQADLTENQRRELIAQLADLQALHGDMRYVYTGDAEAAEEAQERINAALASIKSNYQQLVLDIVAAKLAEKFGESSTAVDIMLINLQESMGLLDSATATMMRNMVMNSDELARVTATAWDDFMADGRITQEEMNTLNELIQRVTDDTVTGMGNVTESTGNATQAIRDAKDAAQEFANGSPYTAQVTADTSAAMAAIAEVQAAMNNLGVPGGYRHPDAPSGGGGAGGVAPPSQAGGGNGGGYNPGPSPGGGNQGPPEFAMGGYTGSNWGVVHPGEFVLPAAAVSSYGIGTLEQMRNGGGMSGPAAAPQVTIVLPNYTGNPQSMAQVVAMKVGEIYGNRMK